MVMRQPEPDGVTDPRADDWGETAETLALGDPGDAFGPVPRPTRIPRWFALAGPPPGAATTVRAVCRRANGPITVDGIPDEAAWAGADWSEPFVAIEDGSAVPLESRVALLWDDHALYAAFAFHDPDPAATDREHHHWVFLGDPDAELFVAGPEGYLETGINPLGTIYQIRWQWLEPLVERRDHAAIDRLLMIPNGLFFTARPGERSGRMGDLDWELPGGAYAARVGTVAAPGMEPAHGWSAEFALPWSGLAPVLGRSGPPAPGTTLRVQAYRAHHDASDPVRTAEMERLWGPGTSPFVGWTWASQGNTNVHNPECWVELTLDG